MQTAVEMQATNSSHGCHPFIVLTILNDTITKVGAVKAMTSLETVQEVLSVIASILTIVKDTTQNKDDFMELASHYNEICLLLWRISSETSNEHIRPDLVRILSDLKKSVDGVHETLTKKLKRGKGYKVLFDTVDPEIVMGWKVDLGQLLQAMKIELNAFKSVDLDELAAMFEERCKNTIPNPLAPNNHPPRPERTFFGRDKLVCEAVGSLLAHEHVALLGSGGIGKSSIAKAVLNHPDIAANFGEHRYFVRFDNVLPAQVTLDTFLYRIANALGLKPSKASRRASIMAFMTSKDSALLVLDNAETFFGAPRDLDCMSEVISDLGSLRSVTIMMTMTECRKRKLPHRLLWRLFTILGLDRDTARDAFLSVYHGETSLSTLDKLLSTVAYHPFCIHLLSTVAVQNGWSLDDVEAASILQETHLLEAGNEKPDSLTITVELCLQSPLLTKFGNDARHVMQIIAFLPQGVDQNKLIELFPSIPAIRTLVDALCKLSLTYRDGDFVTMLASLRLYIAIHEDDDLPQIPLLNDIRTFYYSQLDRYGSIERGTPNFEGRLWIETEDTNVERLLAYDLYVLGDIKTILSRSLAFMDFVDHLVTHKPRPTSLVSLIDALPDEDPRSIHFLCTSFPRPLNDTRKMIHMKAFCMKQLGRLEMTTGHYKEALEVFAQARDLFLLAKDPLQVMDCFDEIADTYVLVGRYGLAEVALKEALKMADTLGKHVDPDYRAALDLSFGRIRMTRGGSDARKLLAKVRTYAESVHSSFAVSGAIRLQGYAEMFAGNFLEARKHFEVGLALHTSGSQADDVTRLDFLMGLAGIAVREDKPAEAQAILDQIWTLALKVELVDFAGYASLVKAALDADQGNYALARHHAARAITETTSTDGEPINEHSMYWLYVSARTELFAHNWLKANELFLKAKEFSDALWNCDFSARNARALGEVALLRNHVVEATKWFVEAKSICDCMGISPKLLYLTDAAFKLRDDYGGWMLFLDGSLS